MTTNDEKARLVEQFLDGLGSQYQAESAVYQQVRRGLLRCGLDTLRLLVVMQDASGGPTLPPGFREGHCGDLACPHRDVSCCDACAAAHVEIVDVCSQHFWIADASERASLQRELSRSTRVEALQDAIQARDRR